MTWLWPSSRPCWHGSRERQSADALHPGVDEHAAAGVERRARRHDIVDQHDDGAPQASRVTGQKQASPTPSEREGPLHIGSTQMSGQPGLGPADAHAAQHTPHGAAQGCRQGIGLVEAALNRPERVNRYGHDRIGPFEQVVARVDEPRREWVGECASPAVLEGVDGPSQGTFVSAHAARRRETGLLSLASETPRTGEPRREWLTAQDA